MGTWEHILRLKSQTANFENMTQLTVLENSKAYFSHRFCTRKSSGYVYQKFSRTIFETFLQKFAYMYRKISRKIFGSEQRTGT